MTDLKAKRNTEGLAQVAQEKRKETFERLEKGIQSLIKERKVINFNTVAAAAGVSKAWLYREPEVKARIEQLRKQATPKKEVPAAQKASDASKDALIKTLRERIKKIEAENQDLRRQNEVAYGQVLKVRDLEKQIVLLKQENRSLLDEIDTLTPSAQSADLPKVETSLDIYQELRDLGIQMNSTLAELIKTTPEGIVSTAIAALKEARSKTEVKNPAGFFYKAVSDAWKPNEVYQHQENIEVFNEWWRLAYGKRLVVAATQKDGRQFVLTPDEVWISFEAMLGRYPIKELYKSKKKLVGLCCHLAKEMIL